MINSAKLILLIIILTLCFTSCEGQEDSSKSRFEEVVKKQDTLKFVKKVLIKDTLKTKKITFKFKYKYPSLFWEYFFWNYLNSEISNRVKFNEIDTSFILVYKFRGHSPAVHRVSLSKLELPSSQYDLYKKIVLDYATSEFNYLEYVYTEVTSDYTESSAPRTSYFLNFIKRVISQKKFTENDKVILNKMKVNLIENKKMHLKEFINFLNDKFPLK